MAIIWSVIAPGTGHLINHRLVLAFFLISWWAAILYFSHVLAAIHFTLYGMFEEAKNVVSIQWLLNIPSVYFFCIFDSYVVTVEGNKLFKWEQDKFLRQQYQPESFPMPFDREAT